MANILEQTVVASLIDVHGALTRHPGEEFAHLQIREGSIRYSTRRVTPNAEAILLTLKASVRVPLENLRVTLESLKDRHHDLFKGTPFSVQEFRLDVKKLTVWSNAAASLMRWFRKNPEHPLKEAFTSAEVKRFHRDDVHDDASILQRFIDFEEVIAPIPYPLIKVMLLNEKLTPTQTTAVCAWIRQILARKNKEVPNYQGTCEVNKFAKVHNLHKLFFYLGRFVEMHVRSEQQTVHIGFLEHTLYHLGLTTLSDPDPKHIAWRDSLEEGGVIEYADVIYPLGSILENREKNPRKELVFEIWGDPRYKIVIYPNYALSYIKKLDFDTSHCGIEESKTYNISAMGRFSILERTYHSLSELNWVSEDGLTPEDQLQAQPVVDLLIGLKTSPITPADLRPENFAFNCEGLLRSNALSEQTEYNFEKIIDFVAQLSKGKLNVFTYLINKSELHTIPYAENYKIALESALKNETILYATNAEKNFYAFMQTLQKECKAHFDGEKDIKVDAAILALFVRHRFICSLWPELRTLILERVNRDD